MVGLRLNIMWFFFLHFEKKWKKNAHQPGHSAESATAESSENRWFELRPVTESRVVFVVSFAKLVINVAETHAWNEHLGAMALGQATAISHCGFDNSRCSKCYFGSKTQSADGSTFTRAIEMPFNNHLTSIRDFGWFCPAIIIAALPTVWPIQK